MNGDQAKASMIKATRREVLAVLNDMYHIGPLGFVALCAALVHLELPDDECVKRDLTYLREKGYVMWTNEGRYVPWNKRLFKLTATGNEIASAINEDPALNP